VCVCVCHCLGISTDFCTFWLTYMIQL